MVESSKHQHQHQHNPPPLPDHASLHPTSLHFSQTSPASGLTQTVPLTYSMSAVPQFRGPPESLPSYHQVNTK